MCRQCLVGGNYSLLDQLHGFAPNPDYWLAWAWRQLVGNGVLAVAQVMPYEGDFVPEVRGYMACTRDMQQHAAAATATNATAAAAAHNNSSGDGGGGGDNGALAAAAATPGSVTFIYLNQHATQNKSIFMYQQDRFSSSSSSADPGGGGWGPTPPPFAMLPRLEFVFTAPGGDLLSRTTALNGHTLQAAVSGGGVALPDLGTLAVAGATEAFSVPPQSYGFAVYPNAGAQACM